jgi:hypothetical protein
MNASDSTVISTARLTRLCGLRETRLRELAEEGWIPKPSRREHALAATIAGLFRYYRDHEEKQNVQDVYESFEECSAAVGIPVKVLKRAKRLRRSAKLSRVGLDKLSQWLSGSGVLLSKEQTFRGERIPSSGVREGSLR